MRFSEGATKKSRCLKLLPSSSRRDGEETRTGRSKRRCTGNGVVDVDCHARSKKAGGGERSAAQKGGANSLPSCHGGSSSWGCGGDRPERRRGNMAGDWDCCYTTRDWVTCEKGKREYLKGSQAKHDEGSGMFLETLTASASLLNQVRRNPAYDRFLTVQIF